MEKAAARGRKRKVGLGESELTTSSVELKTRRLDVVSPENSGNSACDSVSSDHVSASCCSSNGSSELARGSSKSVDLEENEVNLELIATSAGESVESRDRRGTTPWSEMHVQSGELESTARPPRELNSPRPSMAAKRPSEAELEELFAVAEKNLQKQFIDKYNYDIVKDEPLPEGRYEWVPVPLKP